MDEVPSQAGGAVLHPIRSKAVVGILSAKKPPSLFPETTVF
jgi:hypothetical protein